MVNWDEIDRLARAHRVIDPSSSEEDLWRQLKLWWCVTYNRPFRDPLIETYTLDELVYEYLCHHYLDPEHDPLAKVAKEAEKSEDDAWIAEQMKKVIAQNTQPQPKPPEVPKPEMELPPDLSVKFD